MSECVFGAGGDWTKGAGRESREDTHFVGNEGAAKDVGMKNDCAFWTSGFDIRIGVGGSEGDRVGALWEGMSLGSVQLDSLVGCRGGRAESSVSEADEGFGVGTREVLALLEE
jgi:hypothetical protein